jgi:hypothetical protein
MGYNDYMTIEQVEQILPTVSLLVERARMFKREIEALAAHYNYDHILMQEEKPRLQALAAQLRQSIEALEDLGCYIKDLDVGIVDFLSTFEGRDIFLCWRLGEREIKHWHELNESFAQREEIIDLTCYEPEIEFEIPFVENEN